MSGKVVGVRVYLFESVPDLIPYGRLTDIECALWGRMIAEEGARLG